MKYTVGFQLYGEGEEPFSQIVRTYREHIAEVFFAWQDIPTGRSAVATRHGYTDWGAQARLEEELRAIKALGVKLDILFNGNCYGAYALSEKLANTVTSVLEHLAESGCAVDVVTTASPAIAFAVKRRFPQTEVRASVNMGVGTVKGMTYLADYFDSFHIKKECNRRIDHLKMLRKWADGAGKKLVMLANSGCFRDCSWQIFHDNLVAHEAEICEVKNLDGFTPYGCWTMLKDKQNYPMLLQNTWVRPEDIHHYEGIIDTVKLATRMHAFPGMVVDAYVRQDFVGNTLDLFEPGFGRAIAPYIISNKDFPPEWFTKTSLCDTLCHRCGYCRSVLDKVMVRMEG